jgi:hypothetical protein
MSVQFGELGLADTDDDDFELYARLFNTVVQFLPPVPGRADELTWRVATEDLDEEGLDEPQVELLGPVSVAQVVDAAPVIAHEWILGLTEVLAEDMLQTDVASERMAGLRLHAEWKQAKTSA